MTTPAQTDQNFWGYVDEEAEKGGGSGVNFGQLNITPSRYIHWIDGQPTDVTPEAFAALPSKDKSLELMFSIDVASMNPSLDWMLERAIRPGDKAWHKTLKPSLIALLGEDAMSKGNYSATLQSLVGKYVEVKDVPQQKSPEYSTMEFVRIFASKEECFAAYKERFPNTDDGAATPAIAPLAIPPNYTPESWAAVVPAIKEALKTQAVPEVATQYQVDIPFIAEISGQAA